MHSTCRYLRTSHTFKTSEERLIGRLARSARVFKFMIYYTSIITRIAHHIGSYLIPALWSWCTCVVACRAWKGHSRYSDSNQLLAVSPCFRAAIEPVYGETREHKGQRSRVGRERRESNPTTACGCRVIDDLLVFSLTLACVPLGHIHLACLRFFRLEPTGHRGKAEAFADDDDHELCGDYCCCAAYFYMLPNAVG